MGRVWVFHFPPQAPLPPLLGVPSQMWVSPNGTCKSPQVRLSPSGGRAMEVIRGVWGAGKAAFGSSAGEEQRSCGYYFCFAEKLAVLGWQRETRHQFKVKLQWLWPKNQKNNPMRVIQSVQPCGPGGRFSFVSLPKRRARSWL